MTYDLSDIMARAWEIVRRFEGNGETVAERLSRALKSVWWRVKMEARVRADVDAEAARMAAIPQEQLEAAVRNYGYSNQGDAYRIEWRRRMAS